MGGLSLNVGGWGSGGLGTAVPVAASQPGSPTVTQAAFGIGDGAAGDTWAAQGSVVAAVAAAALLVFLWHSLPR